MLISPLIGYKDLSNWYLYRLKLYLFHRMCDFIISYFIFSVSNAKKKAFLHCPFKYIGTSALKLNLFQKMFEKQFVWKPYLLCLLARKHVTDHTGISVKDCYVKNWSFVRQPRRFCVWTTWLRTKFVRVGRCLRTEIWLYLVSGFELLIVKTQTYMHISSATL